MNGFREAHGVQVVRVEEGGYQLNEEELAQVLLHPDVADCAVAVVSVAGAYRGGKSFLLDFFLRYLRTENGARKNGSWLGNAQAPLKGFSWRGGSERDTTGLLLWSQPGHLVLPSGEPVAVLLMDTQGSFDCHSTVRDCSTVFALATLLSSVQVYNLSQNIGEDDLQHLQLFTEYGKMALASSNGFKPFQRLMFLVRDWAFAYEHPFGVEGGAQLLNKRLQIDSDQAEELKEIREHIQMCYDDVSGFLLPHPGFTVFDPNFTGCLDDLRSEFKESLLELVPSIFDEANLAPKLIEGQRVTGRDLFHYFRTYVNLFNSGELPQPQTILRATAEAAMLSAVEAARALYGRAMESACGAQQGYLTPATLRTRHAHALDEALEHFTSRRFGTSVSEESTISQLAQELEDRLAQYELINDGKYQRALADAKATYQEMIQAATGTEQLCLHPKDLEQSHRHAVLAAVYLFDAKRQRGDEDEDTKKETLLRAFDEYFNQFRQLNEANNAAAVTEARDDYNAYMEGVCGDQPCMNPRRLELQHQEAHDRALQVFASKRTGGQDHKEDIYRSQLRKDIDEKFSRLHLLNERNNDAAVRVAVREYNVRMGAVCSAHLPYLHPDELLREHEIAAEHAYNEFHSRRPPGDDDEDNAHLARIHESLSRRFTELSEENERRNSLAVEEACASYRAAMETVCGRGQPQLQPDAFDDAHRRAVDAALRTLDQQRRPYGQDENDQHRNALLERLAGLLQQYRELNAQNPDEIGTEATTLETAIVAVGAAALAAGTVAAVVSTGGVVMAAGFALTAAEVTTAAATAAGVAASAAAVTWTHLRRVRGLFRRNRQ